MGREGKGQQTRAQILETALRLANKVGMQGLTIGGLAKAVGMSKSGLFAHFNSKDNLQLDLLKHAASQFTDSVLRPAFKLPRGEPRVRAILNNWLTYLEHPEASAGGILISASIELNDQPDSVRSFIQKVQIDLIRDLQKSASIAVHEGHFRPDTDTELFAWSLYSFVLGYYHSRRMLEDPRAEEHVKRSFEGLIRFSRSVEPGSHQGEKEPAQALAVNPAVRAVQTGR